MLGNKWFSAVGMGAFFMMAAAATFAATPIRTIDNPVPEAGDLFGRNLMATGNGLIVTGSQFSNAGSIVDAGEAYIINAATGAVLHTLPNPEPQTSAGYGAFAWAGDTNVAVSAFWKNEGAFTQSGRVYIFDLATGTYSRAIHNPTPGTDEFFGYGLGMLGDILISSARGDDTDGVDSGIVYLFDSHTGALLHTLHNPAPTTQDNFGYSVCGFAGNKVAVSAPGRDEGATDAGAVFVFDADTGSFLYKITAPDPVAAGQFGFQVRARGNDLIVGAPGQQKAYLFDGDTGKMILRLNNPDFAVGEVFGSSVAAAGHHILVGDPYHVWNSSPMVGRAYLFNGNTGALMQTFDNPSPAANERYGVSVVGDGNQIIIGADQNMVSGQTGAGSLYVYDGPVTAASDWALYW